MNLNKTIGILLANRANWARSETIIANLIELKISIKIFACSSMILEKFGNAINDIDLNSNNVKIIKLFNNIESETLLTQTLSTGILIQQLSQSFQENKVDAMLLIADRYEVLAGAISAKYQNIPLIHVQGGEISGNIDDKVRNAVSSMSDLHFPCSEKAYSRLKSSYFIKGNIFCFGCPSIDLLFKKGDLNIDEMLSKYSNLGKIKEKDKPYNLVMYHPETENFDYVRDLSLNFYEKIFEASKVKHQIVLWPNIDAGSDKISKVIRELREKNHNSNITFYKNFLSNDFVTLLKNADLLVGNSSSFIREGSTLGIPTILIGIRQRGRDLGENILKNINVDELKVKELEANYKKMKKSYEYGEGNAGKRISLKIIEFLRDR